MEFKEWLRQNELQELNFKDGGDTKHSLAAIAAAMAGGLGGAALGGPLGGVAGFLGGKQLMTHLYPADGTNMKKGMKKGMKK